MRFEVVFSKYILYLNTCLRLRLYSGELPLVDDRAGDGAFDRFFLRDDPSPPSDFRFFSCDFDSRRRSFFAFFSFLARFWSRRSSSFRSSTSIFSTSCDRGGAEGAAAGAAAVMARRRRAQL